jgi:hypothetical protein
MKDAVKTVCEDGVKMLDPSMVFPHIWRFCAKILKRKDYYPFLFKYVSRDSRIKEA